jgi:hypothetical protein
MMHLHASTGNVEQAVVWAVVTEPVFVKLCDYHVSTVTIMKEFTKPHPSHFISTDPSEVVEGMQYVLHEVRSGYARTVRGFT